VETRLRVYPRCILPAWKRLPKEFELRCGPVSIRKEGCRIILEELSESGWPAGFFQSVRINRDDFGREPLEYREKTL
jgi:hypothetical protein